MTTSHARATRPLALGAAAVGVCLLVNLVDPNVEGSLGACPFRVLTGGMDCPGCGVLRATRALTRGDLLLAADHNLLALLVLPVLAAMLVSAVRTAAAGRDRAWHPPPAFGAAVALAVPVFWIVRNLPAASWLGSGTV